MGDYCNKYRDPAMGFCSEATREASVLSAEWASGNLSPRSSVGVGGWRVTKRKHQG